MDPYAQEMSFRAYKKSAKASSSAKGKRKLYSPFRGPRRVDRPLPQDALDGPVAVTRPVFLKGGRRAERKYHDEDISIAGAATWTFDQDTEYKIQQGTAQGNRIGDKITIKRISFRGKIRLSATNADVDHICRVCLFLEKDNAGAASTYGSFFSSNSLYSHRALNVANTGEILFDRVINVTLYDTGSNTDRSSAYVQFSIPCNIPIDYIANAGAVADVRGNHLSMGFIVDNATGGNYPDLTGKLRLTYTDK